MPHRSRLGCIVIECHTDHVEHAAGFWSEALGHPCEMDEERNLATLFDPEGDVAMVVRGVSGSPSVELDIETDDIQAEIRRLERIGARKLGVLDHSVVMEAPTGHRFCVVQPHGNVLGVTGRQWDET